MQISGITGPLQRVHGASLFVLAVAITAPTASAHRLSPAFAEFNHLRAVFHLPKSPRITPRAARVWYSTSFAQCGRPTYVRGHRNLPARGHEQLPGDCQLRDGR
jgi:hypothetical protein